MPVDRFTDLEQIRGACRDGVALCIGMFDGVHRGHQKLIGQLTAAARRLRVPSLAFTFGQHPLRILAPPYAPPLLSDPEEKLDRIERLGVDLCLMLDFTPAFASIDPDAFLNDIVVDNLHARYIACGDDFRFGAKGAGDIELLKTRAADLGFEVEVCPSLIDGGRPIKSMRVRQCLIDGQIDEAQRLLGRPYRLTGCVVPGDERGRTLGYPTANLSVPPRRLIPKDGVYVVRVASGERQWGGMMNIGVRPTFPSAGRSVEVNLFDFEGDLYDRTLICTFVRRIRDELAFDSVDALVEQIRDDEKTCRKALKE